MLKKIFKVLGVIILLLVITYCLLIIFVRPSTNRDWALDQAVLPYAEITGKNINIYNIRNFKYKTVSVFFPEYYDKKVNLEDLTSVDFVVEPFSGYVGAAHTFLTFGFKDGSHIAISVEIRKEKGESFSALKGLLRKYELMYVIADEKDVVKLRTNYRHDQVFLYPIKTTTEKIQSLFIDMLNRTNKLKNDPEFYNTLTNTCTTNIVSHLNKLTDNKVFPYSLDVLFPANSDEIALKHKLINTDKTTIQEVRQEFNINKKAEEFADSPDFSIKIRER